MKTATEEAIQLDRMIATAERIAEDLTSRWVACTFRRGGHVLGLRARTAWRRVDRLVDIRDSAAIPTR
jgi:hypothetical protein